MAMSAPDAQEGVGGRRSGSGQRHVVNQPRPSIIEPKRKPRTTDPKEHRRAGEKVLREIVRRPTRNAND